MGRILGHICLSLINDAVVINLQSTKVYMYSQILCYVSAKFFNILNATKLGRTELREYEPREATEILRMSKESRRNSSGTLSQGFTTLQLCDKISDLLSSMGQTPESFTGRILFMSMFNDISCDRYDNKDE